MPPVVIARGAALARGLFAAPWRIFFVLAALQAMLAPLLALWAGMNPARHGAGMVLGLGLGAVAGYGLTALPGWDGAGPVPGRLTAPLAALWVLALLAVDRGLPPLVWPFPLALAAALLRRGRGNAKRPLVGGAAMAVTGAVLALGPAAGVTVLAALICVIGGRAVPAFLQSAAGRPAVLPRTGHLAAALLTLGTLVLPWAGVVAALAVLAQTRRWPRRAWATGAGAMLAASWLALAAGLALGALGSGTAGLHLLGMGAMGGMIAAIGGRAGMRRVDGLPRAGGLILAAFALIQAAALLRAAGTARPELILPAAALWSAGWAAWLLALRPALAGRPPRPAFSGARREPAF